MSKTVPPTKDDEAALAYAKRLAQLEAKRRDSGLRALGMVRVQAEAWYAQKKQEEKKR